MQRFLKPPSEDRLLEDVLKGFIYRKKTRGQFLQHLQQFANLHQWKRSDQ